MAQSERQAKTARASQPLGSESILVDETKPRKVCVNGNGTRQSSLPEDFCNHVGIEGGSAVQMSLHPGGQAVEIAGPCIIIQPHPQSND